MDTGYYVQMCHDVIEGWGVVDVAAYHCRKVNFYSRVGVFVFNRVKVDQEQIDEWKSKSTCRF